MNDLISIVFTLTAQEDTSLPVDSGRILQASFLSWLKQDHPELAVKLHDANYRRPYTISPLYGKFARDGRWLKIKKFQEGWFRLTGIEQHFNECVQESIAARKQGPEPEDGRLTSGPVLQVPEEHDWAKSSSFEEIGQGVYVLSEKGRVPEQVSLYFQSPACFIENKNALPLPIPRYVFGYLANQWQLASPFELPLEDLQHFVESIHLAYARIDTRMVDLKKYRRVGFIGTARFALHPALPLIYRQSLHLLAKFAVFSGVGSHTTMGMGQCRES
jgi:CRISPR-associated endoribonuclease Cas6